MSQGDLASALELNVSTWSRIENGDSALTLDQLAIAATKLNTRPGALLQAVDEKVSELQSRGIQTTAERLKPADIASLGAIPIVGVALGSVLGPLGSLAVGHALIANYLQKKQTPNKGGS